MTAQSTDSMTRGFGIARIIVSVCAATTTLGAFAADFNKTHLLNPRWPPHAKFHDGQTILLALLLSVCALFFAGRRNSVVTHLRIAVVFASLS